MVVVLALGSVGTDDRCGTDQYPETCIAGENCSLEPSQLIRTPDRLARPVRHRVGRPVQSSLDQPDLQIASPANRAVGQPANGHLLAIDRKSLFETQGKHPRCRFRRPAIVHPTVVIVDFPVAGDIAMKLDMPWQRIHAVPVKPREFHRPRPRRFAVEIHGVPGRHEEVQRARLVVNRENNADIMVLRCEVDESFITETLTKLGFDVSIKRMCFQSLFRRTEQREILPFQKIL